MTNETLLSIKNRRSIRKFESTQIKDDELQAIIESAQYAPSGKGQQPWHFTIVQNQTILDDLSEVIKIVFANSPVEFLQGLGKNKEFHAFYKAPTAIIVSGNQNNPVPTVDVDCACAVQNIFIASTSLSIGSCWTSGISYLHNSPEYKSKLDILKIPENYKPIATIILGYIPESIKKAQIEKKLKENTITYIK